MQPSGTIYTTSLHAQSAFGNCLHNHPAKSALVICFHNQSACTVSLPELFTHTACTISLPELCLQNQPAQSANQYCLHDQPACTVSPPELFTQPACTVSFLELFTQPAYMHSQQISLYGQPSGTIYTTILHRQKTGPHLAIVILRSKCHGSRLFSRLVLHWLTVRRGMPSKVV